MAEPTAAGAARADHAERSPAHVQRQVAGSPRIHVQVVYARPDRVWQHDVTLAEGSTVADAIAASGFAKAFPQVDPLAAGVGVFGVRREPGYRLADGDRVEIYRPLVFDPMESRRRRAQHKARRRQG